MISLLVSMARFYDTVKGKGSIIKMIPKFLKNDSLQVRGAEVPEEHDEDLEGG